MDFKKLLKPPVLLGWLLLLLPFERIPSTKLAGVTLRLSIIAGLALIATVAWQRREKLLSWTKLWPVRLLGLYLFVVLLASLASLHPTRSFEILAFDLYVTILGLAVADTVKAADLGRYRRWLTIGAVIALALGAYQFFGDLGGLPIRITGLRPDYTKAIFGFPRIQAASLEPLFFANYLMLPLAVLAALSLTSAVSSFLLIAIFTESLLTVSRGGAAATLIVTAAIGGYGLWQRYWNTVGRLVATLMIGAGLAVLLITVVVPVFGRIHFGKPAARQTQAAQNYTQQATNYEVGNSLSDRAITRSLGIEIFKQHPLLGAGPGSFGYFAHSLHPELGDSQTVNNLPIEVLAETGVLGFTALAAFVISLLIAGWQGLRKTRNKSAEQAWILGLLAFMIATAVQYQTFSTVYITHIWVAAGLLLGLSVAITSKKPRRRAKARDKK